MENRSVIGYQFEPRPRQNMVYFEEEPTDSPDPTSTPLTTSHLSNKHWCTCNHCIIMPEEKECLCCHEVENLDFFKLKENNICITEHEDFHAIVLLRNALWTAMVALHDRESRGLSQRDAAPNKSFRYAAYRQFCWFAHNRLGKGVRRVHPACVVTKIREAYPSEDGTYVGFREGAEENEAVLSWETFAEDMED